MSTVKHTEGDILWTALVNPDKEQVIHVRNGKTLEVICELPDDNVGEANASRIVKAWNKLDIYEEALRRILNGEGCNTMADMGSIAAEALK